MSTCPVCYGDTPGPAAESFPEEAMRVVRVLANEYRDPCLRITPRLVAVTGLSARGVQLLCRKHWDLTPGRLLTRVRMFHAHAALLAAVPVAGKVGEIAQSVGYRQLSRFGQAYSQEYGETASTTLRRGTSPALPSGIPEPENAAIDPASALAGGQADWHLPGWGVEPHRASDAVG